MQPEGGQQYYYIANGHFVLSVKRNWRTKVARDGPILPAKYLEK